MNDKLIRKAMSELGRRSAAKLTPEERTQRARQAVNKRWENYRNNKASQPTS